MDEVESLSPNGFKGVAIYSGVLFIFGCLTQTIACIIFSRRDYRKKVMTPYFINIAVGNFLFLFGSLPTTFASSLMQGRLFYEYPVMCNIFGFISGCGAVSMIVTMSCTTVKLYAISKSGISNENSSTLQTPHYKVITAIWVYTVILMLPPATGITNMKTEGSGTHCVPDWSPKHPNEAYYVMTLLIFAYVIPVSVGIIHLIRIQYQFNSQEFFNSPLLNLCFSTLKGIQRMSSLAVALFLITWFPYAILVVISVTSGIKVFSIEVEMWPTLFVKLSAVFNPYIYAFVNPRFRRDALELLKCFLCRKKSIVDNVEQDFSQNATICYENEQDREATTNASESQTKVRRISVKEATFISRSSHVEEITMQVHKSSDFQSLKKSNVGSNLVEKSNWLESVENPGQVIQ
ncbi:violet-sensitive opsin-like [Exaiptasia diaphana]|uniref:G-protein coupled receptors family 1 profile domain-containing protein n=1 Tax=Exaiptasia diaphana TaxID=2652724 RepID=A0A913XSJ5_EXADI|nr:violet-sensitive opsin-like [Exaiptasia diaphana]